MKKNISVMNLITFINKKVSKGSSQQHILQNKIKW